MSKFKDKFNNLPVIRNVRAFSFRFYPPGFRGISFGEVFNFYLSAIKDSSVFERAYSASFKFFMALFPGLIFLMTVIPFLPFDNFHKQILTTLEEFIPWQIYQLVEQTFIDVIKRKNTGLLSLGFFIAMFFTTNGMNGLMRAFNDSALITYNVKRLKQRLKAMVLTFFLIVVLFITVLFIVYSSKYFYVIYKNGYVSNGIYKLLLLTKWVGLFGILYLSIATIFFFSPSKKIRHSFFSPGALASTFCIILFTFLFTFYIDNFSNYNKIYGILGTFPILLIWIFLNVLSMLIGFELNISIIIALKNKREHLIRTNPEPQNTIREKAKDLEQ